ncbi:MAG TPA: hypothetical protein VJ885_18585, partial [Thermoanaerobaculia bacterium]|nr:hypothetical protein [Thermoanaerobaculia bacterium]
MKDRKPLSATFRQLAPGLGLLAIVFQVLPIAPITPAARAQAPAAPRPPIATQPPAATQPP